MAAAVTSFLAPWVGGAAAGGSATTPPAQPAAKSYSSLLAFWLGGAGAGGGAMPPAVRCEGRRRRVDEERVFARRPAPCTKEKVSPRY